MEHKNTGRLYGLLHTNKGEIHKWICTQNQQGYDGQNSIGGFKHRLNENSNAGVGGTTGMSEAN